MDTLILRDLELLTRIGVTDEERRTPQRVLLSVDMAVDARTAGKSDNVTQSIDYAAVAEELKTLAKTERKTIERLAEDAATMILERFRPASVTVTVTKFPPLGTRQVELKITRP